jgi:hypothetical protein
VMDSALQLWLIPAGNVPTFPSSLAKCTIVPLGPLPSGGPSAGNTGLSGGFKTDLLLASTAAGHVVPIAIQAVYTAPFASWDFRAVDQSASSWLEPGVM